MSRFTGQDPLGRYLSNGEDYQLCEDMVYAVGDEDSIEKIIVPAGFITDFASVPLAIQFFLPKSIGRRAAVLHDFLYRTNGQHGRYTRYESDCIFLEALGVLGVRATRRYTLYWGVRAGGWCTWSRYVPK